MAKCFYCDEPAAGSCLVCGTPTCKKHQYPVSRWHNVYHASWICEGCYQAKEKKRKYVLIPVLLISAYVIAASMNVIWGIKEPSMWMFFAVAVGVAVIVFAIASIYHAIAKTGKAKKWLFYFLPFLVIWAIIYFVYKSLAG